MNKKQFRHRVQAYTGWPAFVLALCGAWCLVLTAIDTPLWPRDLPPLEITWGAASPSATPDPGPQNTQTEGADKEDPEPTPAESPGLLPDCDREDSGPLFLTDRLPQAGSPAPADPQHDDSAAVSPPGPGSEGSSPGQDGHEDSTSLVAGHGRSLPGMTNLTDTTAPRKEPDTRPRAEDEQPQNPAVPLPGPLKKRLRRSLGEDPDPLPPRTWELDIQPPCDDELPDPLMSPRSSLPVPPALPEDAGQDGVPSPSDETRSSDGENPSMVPRPGDTSTPDESDSAARQVTDGPLGMYSWAAPSAAETDASESSSSCPPDEQP
ncbi:Uncharacterised protein [Propionibacterium australiense]|nr:hypothetical protein D9T14_04425 [Propionibacterium australiense]VEH90978.1 Uncharacterised protein [Propionibacterium australiense]